MSNVVLKVDNVSKQYRLGQLGTGTISHDLNRMWARIRGKEDPYLKVGDLNDRTQSGGSDYVWSLRDIDFEVKQGDVLGIIGKNGAGKSTLLKILSQVTSPTKGRVKVKGRIAALLEVGTGFHPELSGRENIFLNGAILGMSKAEIKSKLDEIVDFSGVAKYLDTPIKRYSSGMMVRLAFAVAAHLEPEILIIDEVLAVGDAEFQKKCLGKIQDVGSQGRTVLFVSHNLSAVQSLCSECLYLANGQKVSMGRTQDIIAQYVKNVSSLENLEWQNPEPKKASDKGRITSIVLKKKKQGAATDGVLYINDELELIVDSEIYGNISGVAYELFVSSIDGTLVACTFTKNITVSKVNNRAVFTLPAGLFNNSFYVITVGISVGYAYFIAKVDSAITFELLNIVSNTTDWKGEWPGLVRPDIQWTIS